MGASEGCVVGDTEGTVEGTALGTLEGTMDGTLDGTPDGLVGCSVPDVGSLEDGTDVEGTALGDVGMEVGICEGLDVGPVDG